MKKCIKCGGELEDKDEFCRHCGAEQEKKRRKTMAERRREIEEETKAVLAKASVSEEEIKNAPKAEKGRVKLEYIGSAKKVYRRYAIRTAAFAAFTAVSLGGLIALRFLDFGDTWRVVAAFALLLFLAYSAASFAESLYSARCMASMSRSGRAVKKIGYGKPPVAVDGGEAYRAVCTHKCPTCGGDTHLEETGGVWLEVCGLNRAHVAVVDNSDIFAGAGHCGETVPPDVNEGDKSEEK